MLEWQYVDTSTYDDEFYAMLSVPFNKVALTREIANEITEKVFKKIYLITYFNEITKDCFKIYIEKIIEVKNKNSHHMRDEP